jgi:hypothetical protein
MTSTKKLTLLLLPLVPLSALGIVEVANAITKPAASTTCEAHVSPTVQPKVAQPEPRYSAPHFAKQPALAPVQAPQPAAVG